MKGGFSLRLYVFAGNIPIFGCAFVALGPLRLRGKYFQTARRPPYAANRFAFNCRAMNSLILS
jgi:hypothetical protein